MGLRHFGGSTPDALIETIVNLDKWATSALELGPEAALSTIPGSGIYTEAPDLIAAVAEYLTRDVRKSQRDLLSKSIQEALFISVGTEPRLSRPQFEARLLRFLRRRGTYSLLRQFLSLHVFNVVWFQSGESVRASAQTNESFVRDMENLERTSRKIVQATFRKTPLPLTPTSAEQLIADIGQRLRSL